ncbi:nitrile hydratase subunit beta [Limnohabitans sp. Rim11]|jgi:nitrile hydratase|uniref:nitrile hydratase subunit beta n=1 Tax=Limnohabitans sp. Rim11 TaxID=1100719 RepID=UPI000AFB159A|nr:nitrile hydratase subunit beta [Limnohabitans sp. Rim11]
MNGVHDMGGQQGFGRVLLEDNEPLFHAAWESRAMAVTVAVGASGLWHIDLSRAARESLPPAVYLSSSYYEIWIRALEKLMLERGMVTPTELANGQQIAPPIKVNSVLTRANVDAALKAGSPTERPIDQPALFQVGQQVRARNMHPQGHTRLPRYVRGHVGTVVSVHGGHVFPDGHTLRATPPFHVPVQWLYTVVFDATTLWGEQSDPTVEVTVDAWESYLEAMA